MLSKRGSTVEALECRRLLSAGHLDPTFGNGGTISPALLSGGRVNALAIQHDGKVIAAGSSTLIRVDTTGRLDRSFGLNGFGSAGPSKYGFDDFNAVAVQKDDKIVAGGYGQTSDGHTDFFVAQSLANGLPDQTFGSGGVADVTLLGYDQINALVIQNDGKIVVAGTASTGPDSTFPSVFALARFTTGGKLDPTFGNHGTVMTQLQSLSETFSSLVLQKNGEIIAGGQSDFGLTLARYQTNGRIDPTFGLQGVVTALHLGVADVLTNAASLALQPNGMIVTGGDSSVARFIANGKLDRSFGHFGIATISPGIREFLSINSVVIQKSGRIIALLTDTEFSPGGPDFNLITTAAFTPTGMFDPSFGGAAAGGIAHAVLLLPNERLIVAGQSYGVGDFFLERLTLSGDVDRGFNFVQQPNGIQSTISAIAVQKDGKIIIAGMDDPQLLRYNANGTVDDSFGVDGHVFLDFGDGGMVNALEIESNGDVVAVGGSEAVGSAIIPTLKDKTTVNWQGLIDDYDRIREHIEHVVPGFTQYNARVREPGGFYLPNAPYQGKFNTPTKKAKFTMHAIPQHQVNGDKLLLTTLRSHDQFNTTIYSENDRYRGISHGRRVVFLNPQDMEKRGIVPDQWVDLISFFEGETRRAERFKAVPYEIPRGCAAAYFPETNVLVAIRDVADKSNQPVSKSIVITIEPHHPSTT